MRDVFIALASVAVGWILFYIVVILDPTKSMTGSFSEKADTLFKILIPVIGVILFLMALYHVGLPF